MIHTIIFKIKTKILSEISFYRRNFRNSVNRASEVIPKRMIKNYLQNCETIIDCGAHIGSDSIELARFFSKARIYSFEPVPAIFASLKRNTRKYSNIECFELALSSLNGEATMNVSSGESDASSSLLTPKEHLRDHPDTYFTETIRVACMTLDYWAEINKVKKIDMLWLDMQGFELKMLQASPKILSSVTLIHTEVSVKETYNGASLYEEYRGFLENNGFRVLIEAIPQGWDMGNVLFIRNQK